MEFSITRLEQVAKILAEEIKEQLAEKQGINEMEKMMHKSDHVAHCDPLMAHS